MFLKHFFAKIANFFLNLFENMLPTMKEAIHVGVQVVENIKKFDTELPVVGDLIALLVPAHLGEKAVSLVRESLPDILTELRLVSNVFNNENSTPEERIILAVQELNKLTGLTRNVTLNSLSILIAQVAADGKLDWNDSVYLMKWYYDHKLNDTSHQQ